MSRGTVRRSRCIFYQNNRKNRYANSILTAERIINSWISALIGIIPNSFGTAERISKMLFFVSLLLFQYFKGHFRLGMPSVGGSRAALSVHKGTFHAPMVRFMRQSRGVLSCSPEGEGLFILIAYNSATTCGRIVCYTLSPHCRDNLKSMWYFNHANK